MIGVECLFSNDGRCQVRRIEIEGQWFPVEQGRQWLDQQGRHVLVRIPGRPVQEIVLRPDTLTWMVINGRSDVQLV
ncbi:MAG: hypothetical protein M5U34_43450 [Chloroflexi bacterium]|nr:hypothetical protein [Chloroflexota bacterium]